LQFSVVMPAQLNDDRIPLRSVPDLRGTATQDASGVSIGRLWGALAEADTGLLRYLDLHLSTQPRHVLVPIGHARLREHQGVPDVRLRAALLEDLQAVPSYEAGAAIADPFEQELLEAHGRAYHGERYYAHPSFDHTGLYAGAHPIVQGEPEPSSAELLPLAELPGFRVASGESDIRGWPVTGLADAPLGQVAELIVDVSHKKVRYVVLETGPARRLLLPVGFLDLDQEGQAVRAPALGSADLAGIPGYTGGTVDRPVEEAVRAALLERMRGRRRYLLPDFNPRALDGEGEAPG